MCTGEDMLIGCVEREGGVEIRWCNTLSYLRIKTPISRSDKIKLKVRRNKSRNNPGAELSAIGIIGRGGSLRIEYFDRMCC